MGVYRSDHADCTDDREHVGYSWRDLLLAAGIMTCAAGLLGVGTWYVLGALP